MSAIHGTIKFMYDPTMRVLAVLEILQARDRVSGAELAERLEVNLRTVQRYIARLQDLAVPVESVRGVGGYYSLKPGFRLPPLMFTDEEAFALVLGLRGLRYLGLAAFAPATEGAASKLSRVLPARLRESLQTVEEVVAVEPGPWVVSTSAESLILVSDAIRGAKRLRFDYQAQDGSATQREIEPYGVIHTDGRWYVAGYCLLRKALRTFRLDRISEPEIREQTFEPPAEFDIKEYLNRSISVAPSVYEIDVWLDLPIAEAHSYFALHRVALEEENGGIRVRCGRDCLEPFAAMLLSIGRRMVVHQPLQLKVAFTELARRAMEVQSA